MMTIEEAVALVESMTLRDGYTAELMWPILYVSTPSRDAWHPQAEPKPFFWSERLDLPDLADEMSLIRRVVQALVQLDLHEHLEFLQVGEDRPINPHRDPHDVLITAWPVEARRRERV